MYSLRCTLSTPPAWLVPCGNVAIMHSEQVISNPPVLCNLGIKNNSHTSIEQSGMLGASTVGREGRSGTG